MSEGVSEREGEREDKRGTRRERDAQTNKEPKDRTDTSRKSEIKGKRHYKCVRELY